MTMTATGYEPTTDLTDLLAALAPFLRCGVNGTGSLCWPRCDGPERRALVAAVEHLTHGSGVALEATAKGNGTSGAYPRAEYREPSFIDPERGNPTE